VIDDDDDDVNVPAASARATIGIQRSSAADAPAADLAAASQIPLPAPHALLVAAKPAPSHAARNPLPAESAPQPSGSTCSTVHCAPTAAAAHGAGLGVCTSVASSCGGAPAAGVAASGAAGAVAPASSGGSAEAQAQPLPVRGGVRYDDPTLDCYVNDMYSYYAQREVRAVPPGSAERSAACGVVTGASSVVRQRRCGGERQRQRSTERTVMLPSRQLLRAHRLFHPSPSSDARCAHCPPPALPRPSCTTAPPPTPPTQPCSGFPAPPSPRRSCARAPAT
jgi:hypothetical protein